MSAKMIKVAYWVLTLPFLLLMAFSVYSYATATQEVYDGLAQLGYKPYILTILGIAKACGIVAILQCKFRTLKEWAYAGFTINMLGAFGSHFLNGDPADKFMTPLVVLSFVLGSYYFWKRGATA